MLKFFCLNRNAKGVIHLIQKTDISSLIEKEAFSHSFQYIFQVDGLQKVGAEFLFRSFEENPEVIFHQAQEENLLYELDTRSILKALSAYALCDSSLTFDQLFLNIYPSTIIHTKFPLFIEFITSCYADLTKNIVFEIIESEKSENSRLLKERVNYLKSLGFQVALDDVGKGWSSLSMIIELEPDYIKLDRYFSNGLTQSSQKQKMIDMLLDYFFETNTQIVLEGIERQEDLLTAQMLGIPLCQGYLLNKPQPIMQLISFNDIKE
jgi:EAL domain-containing protein (putative c-di-GMP-specific phosphodiesterase class I)